MEVIAHIFSNNIDNIKNVENEQKLGKMNKLMSYEKRYGIQIQNQLKTTRDY